MKPNPNGGSIFWFTIPLNPPKKNSPRTQVDSYYKLFSKLNIPKDTRILLVDDKKVALRSLYLKLRILAVPNIDIVTSGKQALVKMQKATKDGNPYSLAIIDMLMPQMDGWRLSAEITHDKTINHTKLYLMVPEGQMGNEAKMKMLDWFSGYLYKPVKFYMLHEMLLNHFSPPSNLEEVYLEEKLLATHTKKAKPSTMFKTLTALIAEDHKVNKKLMENFLIQFGLSVFTASNGQAVVDCIQENTHIDLIFMDIQMPLKTGIQATKDIRKLGYTGIIIACTANTAPYDIATYLDSGMNDILSKPFMRQNIEVLLEKWFLDKKITSPSIAEHTNTQTIVPKKNDLSKDLWDKEDFMDTVGENENLANQLIAEYLIQTHNFLSAAKKAQNTDDYTALSTIAHTLKGSSLTLSLPLLAKIAATIEQGAKNKNEVVVRTNLTKFHDIFIKFAQYTSNQT